MARIALVFVLLMTPQGAVAQPVMSAWIDDEGMLVDRFDVEFGQAFDMVILLDPAGESVGAVEFVVTDLLETLPGILRLARSSPYRGTVKGLTDDCYLDQYAFAFDDCAQPAGSIEVLRLTYGDFSGLEISDVVVALRGLGPGDCYPPSTEAGLGFVSCEGVPFSAVAGGSPGGTTSSGVTWPPGGLILNPARPIPVDGPSASMLKTRY